MRIMMIRTLKIWSVTVDVGLVIREDGDRRVNESVVLVTKSLGTGLGVGCDSLF
jgi:hypothetical protein